MNNPLENNPLKIKVKMVGDYQLKSDIVGNDSACHFTDAVLNCFTVDYYNLNMQSLNLVNGVNSMFSASYSAISYPIMHDGFKSSLRNANLKEDFHPPRTFLFREMFFLFFPTEDNRTQFVASRYRSGAKILTECDLTTECEITTGILDVQYTNAAFRIGENELKQIYIWDSGKGAEKYKTVFAIGLRQELDVLYDNTQFIIYCAPILGECVDVIWPYVEINKDNSIYTTNYDQSGEVMYTADHKVYANRAANTKHKGYQESACLNSSDVKYWQRHESWQIHRGYDVNRSVGVRVATENLIPVSANCSVDGARANHTMFILRSSSKGHITSLMDYDCASKDGAYTMLNFNSVNVGLGVAANPKHVETVTRTIPVHALVLEMFKKKDRSPSVIWISPDCDTMEHTYRCTMGEAFSHSERVFDVDRRSISRYVTSDIFKDIAILLNLAIEQQFKGWTIDDSKRLETALKQKTKYIDDEIKNTVANISPVFVFKDADEFFYMSNGYYLVNRSDPNNNASHNVYYYDNNDILMSWEQKNVTYTPTFAHGHEALHQHYNVRTVCYGSYTGWGYCNMTDVYETILLEGKVVDLRTRESVINYDISSLSVGLPVALPLSVGGNYTIKLHKDGKSGYIAERYVRSGKLVFRYNKTTTYLPLEEYNIVVAHEIINKDYIGKYGRMNTTSVDDSRYIVEGANPKDYEDDNSAYDTSFFDHDENNAATKFARQHLDTIKVKHNGLANSSKNSGNYDSFSHIPYLAASATCGAAGAYIPNSGITQLACLSIVATFYMLVEHYFKRDTKSADVKKMPDPINAEFWKCMDSKYGATPEKIEEWISDPDLFDSEGEKCVFAEKSCDVGKKLNSIKPSTSFCENVWAQCVGLGSRVQSYLVA